jgi:tRNA A37 threonylcarbamoyladenosine dehydratase
MSEALIRAQMLLGEENMARLKSARVAVFGIGGVGSYVVEALVRSGVGTLDLIDNDVVAESNLNRQLIALHSTIGMPKVAAAKLRALDINPEVQVNIHQTFYLPETANQFDFTAYDYVVDAIDTVTGKICLIEQAKKASTPIISSMGTGNKLDPTMFEVVDIYKTSVCPLAKVMRRELKKRGIDRLKVLYSKEEPLVPMEVMTAPGEEPLACAGSHQEAARRSTPGSISFVPSVAGLIIAGEVIKDLCRSESR